MDSERLHGTFERIYVGEMNQVQISQFIQDVAELDIRALHKLKDELSLFVVDYVLPPEIEKYEKQRKRNPKLKPVKDINIKANSQQEGWKELLSKISLDTVHLEMLDDLIQERMKDPIQYIGQRYWRTFQFYFEIEGVYKKAYERISREMEGLGMERKHNTYKQCMEIKNRRTKKKLHPGSE